MKKLPYLSWILLWLTYFVLGWKIYIWALSWHTSLLAISLVLLMAVLLASPASVVDFILSGFMESDLKAFFWVMFLSVISIVALAWFSIFAHFLVLVAAALLARLDIQLAGLKTRSAFIILACLSLTGLLMGIWVHQYYIDLFPSVPSVTSE